MKFRNGWKDNRKQNDRFLLELRLGKLTVFKLLFDISDKHYELVLINFGFIL